MTKDEFEDAFEIVDQYFCLIRRDGDQIPGARWGMGTRYPGPGGRWGAVVAGRIPRHDSHMIALDSIAPTWPSYRASGFTPRSIRQPPAASPAAPWQPSYTDMSAELSMAPPPEETPTIEWVLDKAKSAVLRCGCPQMCGTEAKCWGMSEAHWCGFTLAYSTEA